MFARVPKAVGKKGPQPRMEGEADHADLVAHCKVLERLLVAAEAEIEARVEHEGLLLQEIQTLKDQVTRYASAMDYVEVLSFDSKEAGERWGRWRHEAETTQVRAAVAWIVELLRGQPEVVAHGSGHPNSPTVLLDEIGTLRAQLAAAHQAQQAMVGQRGQCQAQAQDALEAARAAEARCRELESQVMALEALASSRPQGGGATATKTAAFAGPPDQLELMRVSEETKTQLAKAQAASQARLEEERRMRDEMERLKGKVFVLETELAAVSSERDQLRASSTKVLSCLKDEMARRTYAPPSHIGSSSNEGEYEISTAGSVVSDLSGDVGLDEDRLKARQLLSTRPAPTATRCGCYLMDALVAEYEENLRKMIQSHRAWKQLWATLNQTIEAVSGRPLVNLYGAWPKTEGEAEAALRKQEALNVRACGQLVMAQAQHEVAKHNLQIQLAISQRLAHEKTSLEAEKEVMEWEKDITQGALQELNGKLCRAMDVISRLHAENDQLQKQRSAPPSVGSDVGRAP